MIYEQQPENFNPIFGSVSCFLQYKGKVLFLLRHENEPEGNTWALVAGKIDENETPEQAMVREFQEEVNLNVDASDLVFLKKVYVKYSDYDFVHYMFKIELKVEPEIVLNLDEASEYKWIVPEEALNLHLIPGALECINIVLKEKLL